MSRTRRSARLPVLAAPMLAALLLTAGNAGAATTDRGADTAAITAIETEMAGATDAGRLAVHYAPDATVLDATAPGIYRGRAQIEAGFGPQLATLKRVVPTIREISVASDGTMACDALVLHLDRTAQDGTTTPVEVRKLDIFTRSGGAWQVSQQQISMPADMKTGTMLQGGPLPVHGPMQWAADPFAGPVTSPAQARTEIKDWVDRGLRDIGIEHAMSYYGPGNDVSLYGEFAPGNLRGKAEIQAYYAPVMGSFNKIDVTNPVLEIQSDGRLGAQIDTQTLLLHLNKGGTRPIGLRQSDCLRRTGGTWHTFLEMVSFPMDARTGRAIMVPASDVSP